MAEFFFPQTRARRTVAAMQLRPSTRNPGARFILLLRKKGEKKENSKRYRAYSVTHMQKFDIIIPEVFCAYDEMIIAYRKIRII
jgi:hypothetical protein